MAAGYLANLRCLNRDTRLIVGSYAPICLAAFGVWGVLLNLYLLRLGYGPDFVGLVNGAGLVTGAAACLPAAALGRRRGCRPASVAGMVLGTLAALLLPLAQWVPADLRSAWLIALYALYCLGGWGLYRVNSVPLLMQVASEEERNLAFSLMKAFISGGIFLGAIVAGFLPALLASALGTTLAEPTPFALSLLLGPLGFGVGAAMLLATERVRTPVVSAAATATAPGRWSAAGVMGAMAAVIALMYAGYGCINTFYNVYLDEALRVSTAAIGTTMAIGGLIGVPAAMAAPLALSRLGNRKTYAGSYLGVMVCGLALGLTGNFAVAAVAYLAVRALQSLAEPGIIVLQMTVVPEDQRTTMSAVATMAEVLGTAALAFGGGQIIVGAGYRALFLTGAALVLAGVAWFTYYFGRRQSDVPFATLRGSQPSQAARIAK